MTLNNRQQEFCREYIRDRNATRAAIAVGYSPKTARSIGSENLTKPDILAEIKRLTDEKVMSQDEVKTRLADIARGDMASLMDITSSGFTFRLLTENADGERVINPNTKLIKKIKQRVTTRIAKDESGEDSETIETELELYSAHDALRDIGKMYAMFTDKTEISGKVINVSIEPPE
ncbi:MAG: terminase small subunit [Gallionella sp.]|jgi:phage terminase small subunit